MSAISRFPLAGQRTTIEPTAVIKSPAFQVHYPTVRNLEIVIEGVRTAMEESWARGLFEQRDVEIFRVQGAYFSEECLVLDDQLRVISNASDEYTDDEIEAALGAIMRLLDANTLPHLPGTGVVAKRRAANNYGHFLMEMLPMAMIGHAACREREPQFLLHRVQPEMLDVMLRSFRLLGVRPNRLHFPNYLEPMHFEELIVVRGLTAHGTYMSPLCVNAVASLSATVPTGPHKKLFVTRRPGWNRGRSLVNEAQIARRLEAVGFHTIEPGELTLEDQIATFSGAVDVVAVSGAALTNLVFCQPGTRVVNLASAHFPDTFFWFIATHRGLQYSEIRGDPVSGDRFDPTSDFEIRETDIQWLEDKWRPSGNQSGATVMAHVRNVGDLSAGFGEWIGLPGSGCWIEGFSITAPDAEFEYRAVLGKNWLSPWATNGVFCGTRGVALPLHGLNVRRRAESGTVRDCTVRATFTDGSRMETTAGAPCMTESLAPLEAFQIEVQPA